MQLNQIFVFIYDIRRDKIRCNGSRPCASCLKKGHGPEQCIDGCEPCRRARMRCEGGKPCQRCREVQIECTEDTSPAISRQHPVLDFSDHGKNQGSDRAKLACKNCRRDNKKCDDQRPCSRCVSRSEECVHIGRRPKLVKLRCEGCRESGKRCEEARPCQFCVESGKDCVTAPRKGRGHGTRVKAACVACRRDKIRCDGARPCASCARKGYNCIDRTSLPCPECGQGRECVHHINSDGIQSRPSSVQSMVSLQQFQGQGQPMHVPPPAFNPSVYPMTNFIQHLYMPGTHQPILVPQMGVADPKQGYAGIDSTSMT